MKIKAALLVLSACALLATSVFAAEYEIDPTHSTVMFKVRHLGISSVTGKFENFSGRIKYDPKDVSSSSTEATIDVASINTAEKKRDDHLRDPDFFNVAKYPEMKFVSKKVTPDKDGAFQVAGDLTMHGVTLPVVLDVEVGGMAKDMYGNERVAFQATGKLDRRDYGLKWSKLLETGSLVVGNEVTISLEIQGVRKAKA